MPNHTTPPTNTNQHELIPDGGVLTIDCEECGESYIPELEDATDHDPQCPVREAFIKTGRWDDPSETDEPVTDGGTDTVYVAKSSSDRRKHTNPDCSHLTAATTIHEEPASDFTHLRWCPYCTNQKPHGTTDDAWKLRRALLEADPDSIGGESA